MSLRLAALRQTLQKERAGLIDERDRKLREVQEINEALTAIDKVLGQEPAMEFPLPTRRRAGADEESVTAKKHRERAVLRRLILEVVKAHPEGISSEDLFQIIKQMDHGIPDLSVFRVAQTTRHMRDNGLGVMGDGDCWVYVPGMDEAEAAEADLNESDSEEDGPGSESAE